MGLSLPTAGQAHADWLGEQKPDPKTIKKQRFYLRNADTARIYKREKK